jgi:SAM-dependent methyltransferase
VENGSTKRLGRSFYRVFLPRRRCAAPLVIRRQALKHGIRDVVRDVNRGDSLGDDRFGFGENWRKFNAVVTDDQRAAARDWLEQWLGSLEGLTFLDIGARSGLFAAAAAELGAAVKAFDFDPVGEWIERGDVLDRAYMQSLGEFVVYAWGVLHHTGDMWAALGNVCDVVAADGRLFVSIYNDQGWRSGGWRAVKRNVRSHPSASTAPLCGADDRAV